MDSLTSFRVSLRWLLIFGSVILVGSCASPPIQTHDYCQIAKPIYLQKGEAAKLSDESAKAILAHDETWAKICKH